MRLIDMSGAAPTIAPRPSSSASSVCSGAESTAGHTPPLDTFIDKPARIRGYALHRIVAQLHPGKAMLWADEGQRLRIRSREAEPPVYEAGKLLVFTTRACVSLRERPERLPGAKKGHRKNVFLPPEDWRGRRAWLEKEGLRHGFEVVDVHVSGAMERVETHKGHRFLMDSTEFVGVLRVTNPTAFGLALVHGIGRVGRFMGLGMLIVK